VDRLRKSKGHPELKGVARLLRTENIDMARYRPYFHGMQHVRIELIRTDELSDPPSRAFFNFMHSPSDMLSGIVPAAHSIYSLFLQSESFRETLAAFANENIGGPRGKELEIVCALYGSILAVTETYSLAIHKIRGEDLVQHGKAARPVSVRKGGGSTTGATSRSVDLSFNEDLGADEVGPDAPQHRVGITEEEKKRPERDRRREQREGLELLEEQDVEKLFGPEAARRVLAYLKSKGLCGHPQASITELAQEHGLDKTTMYRWVNAAQLGLDIKSFQ